MNDFFSKLKYFKFGGDLILVFYSLEIIEYDLLLRSYDIFLSGDGLNVKQDRILPVIKQQVNEFINKYKDYPIVKNDTRLKELLDK